MTSERYNWIQAGVKAELASNYVAHGSGRRLLYKKGTPVTILNRLGEHVARVRFPDRRVADVGRSLLKKA